MNEWHDLFVAVCGASAALMGLIFVGVSINLDRIISMPPLPGRALISLMLLLTILISTIILLMPAESVKLLGVEILLLGLVSWSGVLITDINILRKKEKEFKKVYLLNLLLNQVALVPYIICGLGLLNGQLHGLGWLVVSFVFSFIKSSLDAWVLLVEINR